MGRLIPVALALLVVGCLMRETAGLPWEHVHRALLEPHIQSTAAMSALSKRGSTLPACPTHPRAVSQAFINQRYMPDRLRKAIANMDASFRSVVAAASIQAASVGLVYDQELVWQQGYGLIDSSDPSSLVDENTIYRVGSVTKLITNLMLFQLRDQGKLSLDEPVSVCCLFMTLTPLVDGRTPTDLAIAEQKYVPELTWPTPYKNNPGITWRTLAGQTSGLTGATPCNFFTLLESILGDACDISNAEAWRRVTAEQPTAPMWQDPHYADGAYAVIGRALESVVGMSYEDYVHQHIFKPLGMDSSYMCYSAWSDMAKRVPPGKIGNITYPSFVSHVDLNWARPTGNVYSTVKDLAKLVSLFMVGQDERKNALGIYSSTLREMLTSSFINDEQTTAYGYPFEVYHSSAFGQGLPPYWVRVKAGSMPGYFTILVFFPEVKTALILQSSGFVMPWDEAIAEVLPAIDQSLWDLQPLPTNPGNLTTYAGVYLASVLGGFMGGNVTVLVDQPNNQLVLYFSISGTGLGDAELGAKQAVWEYGNSFRLLASDPTASCLNVESGFTNVLVHFKLSEPSWLGGPTRVVSVEVPSDPFYGWNFAKQ